MHLHALDEGREHPRLADVLGRDREQVAIENDEIGAFPTSSDPVSRSRWFSVAPSIV